MDLKLKGKRVLVGGATRGIGRAVAEAFAAEGANLEIVARHSTEEIANEISKRFGIVAHGHDCDLSKMEDISLLKADVGDVDILFANVGGPKPGEIEDLGDKEWHEAFDLTLMSVVRLVRAFLPGMILNRWGRVIALTSVSVFEPIPRLLLSNSIRMAVEGLMRSLSMEHGSSGITFNCVAPGYTLTSRVRALIEDSARVQGKESKVIEKEIADRTDVKRLAIPNEIADVVVFLASERASYVTGSTIRVDGGYAKTTL